MAAANNCVLPIVRRRRSVNGVGIDRVPAGDQGRLIAHQPQLHVGATGTDRVSRSRVATGADPEECVGDHPPSPHPGPPVRASAAAENLRREPISYRSAVEPPIGTALITA